MRHYKVSELLKLIESGEAVFAPGLLVNKSHKEGNVTVIDSVELLEISAVEAHTDEQVLGKDEVESSSLSRSTNLK